MASSKSFLLIPSICRTRFGLAVFLVKNMFDDSFPKREPPREGVVSKRAISKKIRCFLSLR